MLQYLLQILFTYFYISKKSGKNYGKFINIFKVWIMYIWVQGISLEIVSYCKFCYTRHK